MRTPNALAATRRLRTPASSALSSAIDQALHMPRMRRPAAAAIVLAALALSAPGVQAQTTEWIHPGSAGSWYSDVDWSAGVPDANTDAAITVGSSVHIDGGQAAARDLTVGNGDTLRISSNAIFANRDSGIDGQVALSTGGTWNGRFISVGTTNTPNQARITLESGSALSADTLWIGENAGEQGFVQAQASEIGAGRVVIGESGKGELSLGDGASLVAGNMILGSLATGDGKLQVSGESSVTVPDYLYVGESGAGWMKVEGQSQVQVGETMWIGRYDGASGEVIVDGAGTRLGVERQLYVGDLGEGELTVSNGAIVEAHLETETSSGDFGGVAGFHIGTSNRGKVVVTGQGSTLTTGNDLALGGRGGNGRLEILDGGTVNNFYGVIGGYNLEYLGEGSALVQDAGSTWNNASGLFIGDKGEGTLDIANGGVVNVLSGLTIIGVLDTAAGTLSIYGPGSTLNAGDGLVVGTRGRAGASISDGGAITAGTITVGSDFSQGEVVMTVADAGSQVDAEFSLDVRSIEGAKLEISSGAVVNSGSGSVGDWVISSGVYYDTRGEASITGDGSRWNVAGDLRVGQNNGAVTVSDHGVLATGDAYVGVEYADRLDILPDGPATVSIQGGGSVWESTGTIHVGMNDRGLLDVGDQGRVDSVGGVLGLNENIGGAPGVAHIDGEGSRWDVSEALVIGGGGYGRLEVEDQGVLDAGSIVMGAQADGVGEVQLTDADSHVAAFDLVVGELGQGTIDVDNRAILASDRATIGKGVGGYGKVTLTGAGTTWLNTERVAVGGAGTGELHVVDGAVLDTEHLDIGLEAGGHGTVRFSGAQTSWSTADQQVVGVRGEGVMQIENGARLASEGGLLATEGGRGEVAIDGAGSQWDVAGRVTAGASEDGHGEITLSNGGRLTTPEALELALGAGSTGVLNFGAGGAVGVLEASGVVGSGGTGVVNFNHNQDLAFDQGLEGTLRVRQIGTGTTTLLRDYAYTNGTFVGDGVLQLGNGGTVGSITGNVDTERPGTLVFNRSDAVDFLGDIHGTGSVHQAGSGTTTFSGKSNYTGATEVLAGTVLVEGELGNTRTTVHEGAMLGGTGRIAGNVIVNDGGTLSPGTSPGTLTVGGLQLAQGAILEYELGQADVVGSGINDLIEIDGDLTLDGTLNVTDVGGFGVGVYRLMNYGGSLTNNVLDLGKVPDGVDLDDLYVQTAIAGQVNLVNLADGISVNFWDGAAGPQNDGIIQGGNGTWVSDDRSWTLPDGSLNGNWNEGFAVFGGEAGTVTVQGEQRFTGMQFMTDGYRLEPGTDAALRASGTTNLRVDPDVTATIAAPIVGDATLVKVDEGTLVLEGRFGYTGGVTVNGGRLVGDTGNLLGDILNRAELEFAQATDATYADTISGSGQLIKSGEGVLTFTGNHTYTGGTQVADGTLRVGNGGTTGALVGDVQIDQAGTLAFDRSDSLTFAGAFSGEGALDKSGPGTLTLTGNSGDYAGQATLRSGGLHLTGTLGGQLDVLAGATLSGTGTLGDVDNAGTIAPGASIGTLHMTGDYVHRSGATYQVDIAPNGSSDLLDIAGTATIEGGEVYVTKAPGQYAGGTRYTIVDAEGGVTGTYDTLDQNLPFLDLALSYDPNHVYLDVRRNDTGFDVLCGNGTFNQCEVARTLASFDPQVPPSEDIGKMMEQVTAMDEETALAAFDRMSGEVHPSLAGIVLEGHALYGQTVSRRMAERREAIGADRLHGGAWVRTYGASSDLDGDGNAHGADWNLHGIAVGYDAWGTENWLIGASANLMRLDAKFRPGDRGEVDANNLSLYTSFQGDRGYLDAVGSYAWWDNDTTRAVQVGDIDRTATADYRSHRFSGYLEAGWNIDLGEGSLLQPLVTVQYDNLASQGFQEKGAEDLSLIGLSDSVERLTAAAGLRWSSSMQRGGWTLAPTAQARWLHSEGQHYAEFDVAYAGAPDQGYRTPQFGWRVRGVTLPKDRGLVGVGLAARKENVDLFVDYDFQAGDGYQAHNLSAGLRYRW